MTARPAIAALIAAGRTDADIAAELGIHRSTVNRTRRDLGTRHLAAIDRITAEAIPTGQVRDYGPVPPRPWTAQEQARHRAELLAALAA